MRDDALGTTSLVLVVVGALNWGLVGFGGLLSSGNWNVVEMLLGQATLGTSAVANVVYILVGLAGLYEIYNAAEM